MLWRPSQRFLVQQDIACRYPGAQEIACLHAPWKVKHHRALLGVLKRLRQSQASDGDHRTFFVQMGNRLSSQGTSLSMQCSLQGFIACILQKGGL